MMREEELASNRDDNDLVEKLKHGDLEALSDMIERFKSELFRLAFRYLENQEDAEEVLQDTFLRAYRNIDSFRGQAKLSTWLYRICVNLSINKLRSRQKWIGLIRWDKPSTEKQSNVMRPNELEEVCLQQERRLLIRKSLEKLQPLPRMIVTLHYLEGLSCAEIGKMMELPANTVKTHLFRARQKLRKHLTTLVNTDEVF